MYKNLVIVGAGFSANAGLPLASNFTPNLLRTQSLSPTGPSVAQIRFIERFLDKVFGEGSLRSPDEWPDLEDVLTIIDLSANTGHHLGPEYSASALRVVRRALLVRMIRMLEQRYRAGARVANADWRALGTFFQAYDLTACSTLSMNWDMVFERGIAEAQSIARIDYGCGARAAVYEKAELKYLKPDKDEVALRLVKPHGSVNWLYCDACRETVWVPPEQTEKVAKTLFAKRDWDVIDAHQTSSSRPGTLDPACLHCGGRALGTRFATFSYRKALDFPMHAASWRSAERDLKRAANWIFIGYSMPPADFEFKAMLKRVQLSETIRPDITVITRGQGADETVRRYEKFFGKVSGERTVLTNGLDGEAMAHLRRIGVLKG